jgi:hypothetical protein
MNTRTPNSRHVAPLSRIHRVKKRSAPNVVRVSLPAETSIKSVTRKRCALTPDERTEGTVVVPGE